MRVDDSTSPGPGTDPGREYVRHKKRGTVYEVLGEAEAQVAVGGLLLGEAGPAVAYREVSDGALFTVYRDPATSKMWCRPTDEFRDGRFETIAPPRDGEDGGAPPALIEASSVEGGSKAGTKEADPHPSRDEEMRDGILAVLSATTGLPADHQALAYTWDHILPLIQARLDADRIAFLTTIEALRDELATAGVDQRAAETFARRAHAGQTDKAGRPYTGHLMRVAARARAHAEPLGWSPEQAQLVADAGWLHDTIEARGRLRRTCWPRGSRRRSSTR